jgi:hypothetical protein
VLNWIKIVIIFGFWYRSYRLLFPLCLKRKFCHFRAFQFGIKIGSTRAYSYCLSASGIVIETFFLMAQQPLVGQGLLIIEASRSYSDTPHSVGLLWTSYSPDAETSTWQHTTPTGDIHAPSGIRTHSPSKGTAANARLRLRLHWVDVIETLHIRVFSPYSLSCLGCAYERCAYTYYMGLHHH